MQRIDLCRLAAEDDPQALAALDELAQLADRAAWRRATHKPGSAPPRSSKTWDWSLQCRRSPKT